MPPSGTKLAQVSSRVRKGVWIFAVIAGGVVGSLLIVLMSFIHPEQLRSRMEVFLEERLESEVDLEAFGAHPLPTTTVDGSGLVLRRRGEAGSRIPFIEIDTFEVRAAPLGLFRTPRRIQQVKLTGVDVHVAPSRRPDQQSNAEQADEKSDAGTTPDPAWRSRPALIEELVAERARLEIQSRNPAKPPRVFEIHRIRLIDASLEGPTRFQASLSIPTPPGNVEASGQVGAWARREPGRTQVEGTYVFNDADLGVFKGISGTLMSTGEFSGPLERLGVRGRTETPDFTLTSAGNEVPLTTEFDALVDGTSGDTILNSVRATLGESEIIASGRVVRAREVKGRLIRVDARVDRARLEDLLRLAVKGRAPPMSGTAKIRAKLEIPPGDRDVIQRIRLRGEFRLARARFNDFDVQKAVATLSRRGRGINANEKPPPGDRVVSNLEGVFALANGRMRFSKLTFSVPGARVDLTGEYRLEREELEFMGTLTTDASISEMTTGWKSVLAKLADFWFRRKGQTVIPIKIAGRKDKPAFGVDTKRALLRKTS
jgi:AsmA-like C-terminal region